MEYIHVRSLDKYNPGYKDRKLHWAKIHFSMVQGDPDCEMIENEIDFARLIKIILLELSAQKPLPNNDAYWRKKGFDLKKRPMSLTLDMLHNFITTDTDILKTCTKKVEKKREESREEKSREEAGCNPARASLPFKKEIIDWWNNFASKEHLPKIRTINDSMYRKFKLRCGVGFWDQRKEIESQVSDSDFVKQNGWFNFWWLIKNDENWQKVVSGCYRNKKDDNKKGPKSMEEIKAEIAREKKEREERMNK